MTRRAKKTDIIFFLAPAIAILAVFRVLPVFDALQLGLTNWDGLNPPKYVGLRNFEVLLSDSTFWLALQHNLLILAVVPIWVILPFFLAAALHSRVPGWRFLRMAYFLPITMSPVIVGAYYFLLLSYAGPLNQLLRSVGLDGFAQEWLANSTTALPVAIAIIIWSTFGTGVMIYMAALAQINPDLTDAAQVDGASWFQVQRHVTLPSVRPVMQFWAVVIVIGTFTNLWPYIFALTGGGPGDSTNIVEYYVYEVAFQLDHPGYASAIAIVLLVIVAGLTIIQSRLFWGRRPGALDR
jgi:ABC-type sugar transport system permease subunit